MKDKAVRAVIFLKDKHEEKRERESEEKRARKENVPLSYSCYDMRS